VVAKRASADPIEPPAPVISKVFPEMYSFNGKTVYGPPGTEKEARRKRHPVAREALVGKMARSKCGVRASKHAHSWMSMIV
jgi:hypothetical protein